MRSTRSHANLNCQVVSEHDPPSDEEDAQDLARRSPRRPRTLNQDGQGQQPSDLWDPPKVAIGENSLDNHYATSYQHRLGPALTICASESSHQRSRTRYCWVFPNGQHPFPVDWRHRPKTTTASTRLPRSGDPHKRTPGEKKRDVEYELDRARLSFALFPRPPPPSDKVLLRFPMPMKYPPSAPCGGEVIV